MVVLVVKTAQAIISRHAHRIHVLRVLLIHALQVTHVQAIVLGTHVLQAIHVLRVLLIPVLQVTHVLRVLLTHVQHALEIPVHPLVHVLLNPKLAVNVETSAVANHDLPSSSQFSLESSRFR